MKIKICDTLFDTKADAIKYYKTIIWQFEKYKTTDYIQDEYGLYTITDKVDHTDALELAKVAFNNDMVQDGKIKKSDKCTDMVIDVKIGITSYDNYCLYAIFNSGDFKDFSISKTITRTKSCDEMILPKTKQLYNKCNKIKGLDSVEVHSLYSVILNDKYILTTEGKWMVRGRCRRGKTWYQYSTPLDMVNKYVLV